MRRTLLTAILLTISIAFFAAPPVAASVSVTVSVSYFHDTLNPYGRWVVTRGYGEVWIPTGIVTQWSPYWDGEWIWTDYGWTWVSYDPWGDIPYHYGTWVWVDPYGWVWVPGTVWAPAWVTWAWSDECIGWAPVPPTFGITASGYSGPAVTVAATRYVFVPANQFVGVNVQSVRLPTSRNATFLSHARKSTGFAVSGGVVRATANPPLSFVQRVSGKRIERVSIEKVKARPTTLAAAHASGKSIRVVAPASERSAAATRTSRIETKTRAGKPSGAASSATTGPPKHSKETHTSQTHVATTGRTATSSSSHESKSHPHEKTMKTERSGPPPTGETSTVRESHGGPPSHSKGERHVEAHEHPPNGPPPDSTQRGGPPPAQVEQNPHSPPLPPPAQAPVQAQKPPPPPKEKGKEKGRD